MIVVTADDLTGAAELAGIGLRYGLSVQINTHTNMQAATDLLVVCTDTRSMSEVDAVTVTKELSLKIAALNPSLLFKKIDSVLRGHIIAEVKTQMDILSLDSALIIPANPSLGRTVKDGIYLLHRQPVHKSSFSMDPEFPVQSSVIAEMLKVGDDIVFYVLNKSEPLVEQGIMVGEAGTEEDIKDWAGKTNGYVLLAGASGFFTALLNKYYPLQTTVTDRILLDAPVLLVSGTSFSKSVEAIKALHRKGGAVSYMPEAMLLSKNVSAELYEAWSNEITGILSSYGKAVIAIDAETASRIPVNAIDLRNKTAKVVQHVVNNIAIRELMVEGGSTAAAIIRQMNYTCFFPVQELAPGVIRMRTEKNQQLHLTIKPGSYYWPPGIFNF